MEKNTLPQRPSMVNWPCLYWILTIVLVVVAYIVFLGIMISRV